MGKAEEFQKQVEAEQLAEIEKERKAFQKYLYVIAFVFFLAAVVILLIMIVEATCFMPKNKKTSGVTTTPAPKGFTPHELHRERIEKAIDEIPSTGLPGPYVSEECYERCPKSLNCSEWAFCIFHYPLQCHQVAVACHGRFKSTMDLDKIIKMTLALEKNLDELNDLKENQIDYFKMFAQIAVVVIFVYLIRSVCKRPIVTPPPKNRLFLVTSSDPNNKKVYLATGDPATLRKVYLKMHEQAKPEAEKVSKGEMMV